MLTSLCVVVLCVVVLACLGFSQTHPDDRGDKSPSKFEAIKSITAMKDTHPFLREALSQSLQQTVRDLYEGWERFFKGLNEKPTWRKHSDNPSFRLPQPDQWRVRNLRGTRKNVRHLFLPKMGMSGHLGPVAFVQHRSLEGKVKHLTITREGGFWYVSFNVERKVKPEVEAQRARIRALVEMGAFGGVPRGALHTAWRVGTNTFDDTTNETFISKNEEGKGCGKGGVDRVCGIKVDEVKGDGDDKSLTAVKNRYGLSSTLRAPLFPTFGPHEEMLGPHPLVVTGVDRNTPKNGTCVTNWGDVYGVQIWTSEREKKLVFLQRVVSRKDFEPLPKGQKRLQWSVFR